MAKIIDRLVGINKKLGKAKFKDVITPKDIEQAEKVESRMTTAFREATADDFSELKRLFEGFKIKKISPADYNKVSILSFSIKSRAGNAGNKLASKVANSLYKFADFMAVSETELGGYDVARLHFAALEEIFNGKFDDADDRKAGKLVSGLELLSEKIVRAASPEDSEEE